MEFDGNRVRLLRMFHNLTMRALADRVGSTDSSINAYERGVRAPRGIALDALAVALGVQPSFFVRTEPGRLLGVASANFRSLASTPERTKSRVLAHTELFIEVLQHLGKVVRLPVLNLPSIAVDTDDDIERAAETCRMHWKVGIDTPIPRLMHLVELQGVVITCLKTAVEAKVNAFSLYDPMGIIVLNSAKDSATMTRLDVAHEVGHGVLHRNATPMERKRKEAQAFRFGGALLMPRAAFSREFWSLGRSRSWSSLFDLKQRWGASMPAIVRRAYDLGMIDAAEYQRRFKYMSRMGWRSGREPLEPNRELPSLFSAALAKFTATTGKDGRTIARELGWSSELFSEVTGVELPELPEDANVASLAAFQARRLGVGSNTLRGS